jgi:hypothetical protein
MARDNRPGRRYIRPVIFWVTCSESAAGSASFSSYLFELLNTCLVQPFFPILTCKRGVAHKDSTVLKVIKAHCGSLARRFSATNP